ncbi:MAG: ABC transporter ATP-binding protein [Chitinophagales bacterium]
MDKNQTGNIFDFKMLKRVLQYASPYKKLFGFSLLMILALSLAGPFRPKLIQIAIDNHISTHDWLGVKRMVLILVVILIFDAIFRYFFMYSSRYLGQLVIKDMRVKVFRHIMNMRLKYFDTTAIGTSTTRTVNDIETINQIFTQGLMQIVADVLLMLVILIWMFAENWKLTLISIVTLPLLFWATYIFKESVKGAFQKVRNAVSDLNAFLQEHITGMKIVQIFAAEKQEYQKFHKINTKHKNALVEAVFYYSVYFPVVEILLSIAIGLMIWLGATMIFDGTLMSGDMQREEQVGILFAFVLWINMLYRPARMLAERFNTLQMGIVASERVFKLLDREETIANNGNVKDKSIAGNIDFQNVSFAYTDGDYVLKDISFSLKKGETLAIVGSTGSGKSTIINVLSRLYPIAKGKVLLDNIDFQDYDLDFYRSQICTVLQDVFLFSGTIIDNVRLYDKTISIEKIKAAAKMIGADEFIEKLPGGYDYEVMERGATLSLGQRQLISFLRALVFEPSILVLDEATSSVDTETEQIVQHAIDKLVTDRTSIVIAHRLSTIQNADKIIVLDKGKVLEIGNPKELLQIEDGHFRKLYDAQFDKEVS